MGWSSRLRHSLRICGPLQGPFFGGPNSKISKLAFPHYARILLRHRLVRPGHAWCVVRDSDVSLGIEDDDAAVSVYPLLQIIHRLQRGPLRQVARRDAVGSPFREDQLHDGLAPSGGRSRGAQIIGVATATDQRRITQPSRSLVQRAAG